MGHFFRGDELRLNWVSRLRGSIVTRRPGRNTQPNMNPTIFPNQPFQDKLQLNKEIYLKVSLISPMAKSSSGAQRRATGTMGAASLEHGCGLSIRQRRIQGPSQTTSKKGLKWQQKERKGTLSSQWGSYPGQGRDAVLFVPSLEGNFCSTLLLSATLVAE